MKLLIGYDGSDSADTAIRELERAGLPAEVEAIVLSVADLPSEVPFATYGSQAAGASALPPIVALAARRARHAWSSNRSRPRRRARSWCASLFPNWKVRFESLVDSPSWAIVRRAEEASVDLVVVGSQGKTGLRRLTLGSVSENVLRHAIARYWSRDATVR